MHGRVVRQDPQDWCYRAVLAAATTKERHIATDGEAVDDGRPRADRCQVAANMIVGADLAVIGAADCGYGVVLDPRIAPHVEHARRVGVKERMSLHDQIVSDGYGTRAGQRT